MPKSPELVVRRGGSRATDPAIAAQELFDSIFQPDAPFTVFYCSSTYDLPSLARELKARFGETPLIGCTSAGEITEEGYVDGTITGVSVSGQGFHTVTGCLESLRQFELSRGEQLVTDLMTGLKSKDASCCSKNTFGFLLIDGLCMQEEFVVSALSRGLGSVPLFGGSAGDGLAFGETHVYYDGAFVKDRAIITLVKTDQPTHVFKTEHFVATDKKLVVTGADPIHRLVTEINGVPAAREYARILGLQIEDLDPMVFAEHPVVVRLAGDHFVRSIMKVNDDESLLFACAIDEGIVFSIARPLDLAESLQDTFDEIRSRIGEPKLILGCDCLLRKVEIEKKEIKADISRIMTANNVFGFNTYGEQLNGMHINQTFTGVAIGRTGTDG